LALGGLRVVDLTLPLGRGTPVYPGDPPVLVERRACVEVDGYQASLVVMGDHSGTHVDAPAHFIAGGDTVDSIPPQRLVGPAVALDFSWKGPGDSVSRRELEEALEASGARPGPGWFVLLSFGWDSRRGTPEWLRHPSISEEAAALLASMGVGGVGVDTPSPDHPPYPVHRLLLGRGILIVENLAGLQRLAGRVFTLVVAPLPLEGAGGAPARVLALLPG